MPQNRFLKLTIYSVTGFLLLLLLLAMGWLGMVYLQSRVDSARPPYLLMNSPDSIRIRWGTDEPVIGRVHYGTQADQLDQQVSEKDTVEDHRVTLKNLQPGTRYYYRIQNGTNWLQPKPEWFYTSPAPEQYSSNRVWILGDPGYASETQSKVRDKAIEWMKARPRGSLPYVDMLLTTGDNAYNSGKTSEFKRNFFQPYKSILKNIPVWPVFGNHDARRWAYYQLFDTPQQGESGGLPSGDRAWYSFDHAFTHYVILDSHHGEMEPGSPMLDWLKRDLQQNRQPWTIVLFHQPPYSKSTHDSDSRKDSRGRLFRVREFILPILEKAGVDLVFSGHSHTYERSHMLSCHYDTSNTLQEWMLQRGKQTADVAVSMYKKPHSAQPAFSGTIYTVLGSSAKVDRGKLNHPVMAVSLRQAGSVILDIDQRSLSMVFLNDSGQVSDQLKIVKDNDSKVPRFDSCEARRAYYTQ
jgi:hypothetical protein